MGGANDGDGVTAAENCIDPELEVRLCGSDRLDRLSHAVGTDNFRMSMTNPIRAQNIQRRSMRRRCSTSQKIAPNTLRRPANLSRREHSPFLINADGGVSLLRALSSAFELSPNWSTVASVAAYDWASLIERLVWCDHSVELCEAGG
jgi:hypothetical protein